MRARTTTRGLLAAAVALFVSLRGVARADDVVFLKNGGRVRGVVVVESPRDGVRIKLADGRIRDVPAAEVDRVAYDADAAAPAPAAPTAPAEPAPAEPPPVLPPSAPPAPPPPPPPKTGALSVDADEKALVTIDGAEAGWTPLHVDRVDAGRHTVEVRYAGGGSARSSVVVEADEDATVSFRVTDTEKAFRPRRGVHLGGSVDGVWTHATGLANYGGGRGTVFVDVGVAPVLDLRAGAYGASSAGEYAAYYSSFGGVAWLVFRAGPKLLVQLGAHGGYAPVTELRSWEPGPLGNVARDGGANAAPSLDTSRELGSGPVVGPEMALGLSLGSSRQWELAARERLTALFGQRSGDPDVVLETSLGVTYLFLAPEQRRPNTRARRDR